MSAKAKAKMKYKQTLGVWLRVLTLVLLAVLLASCGGAEAPADTANNDMAADNNAAADNDAAAADDAPAEEYATPTPPSPQDRIEDWIVDLEWPGEMELGEADVIRLRMTPSEQGLVIEAEFADHTTTTQTVAIERPSGYVLTAVAEIHAVNFEVSPDGPQRRELVVGKEESWYWTITPKAGGRQRLSISLLMEWQAQQGQTPATREFGSFSHGFEIQVNSVFGMSRTHAKLLATLVCLGGLALLVGAVIFLARPSKLQVNRPNPAVRLETQSEIGVSPAEGRLLKTIFKDYSRVALEKEFMSGYSGARTFMTVPLRANQRADARTIVKLSDIESITREYDNYQQYVKHTLPPTTARIQQKPVTNRGSQLAALRYTFIGMPGETPLSLRLALLDQPDPVWFSRLANAYGPNWWMQRSPYTFRLWQEYDSKLPAHLTLHPAEGTGTMLDGRQSAEQLDVSPGEVVQLSHFKLKSAHPQLNKYTLVGEANHGLPALRVSYYGEHLPAKIVGRVVQTRRAFLQSRVAGVDLLGLPDPLEKLPGVLNRTIAGTRSVIHGDLNLENILIGPGNTLWLIDFAETREGHPLFDFAHLYVEVVAHILSRQVAGPKVFLHTLEEGRSLLAGVELAAERYLFNPADMSEFWLAAYVSCLGAQKYGNLDEQARQMLVLAAAYLAQKI